MLTTVGWFWAYKQRNKHRVGCEAQLAWNAYSRPLCFGGRFWPIK